jgi:hypothetical protein
MLVIPAQAGIQRCPKQSSALNWSGMRPSWVPACAGTTHYYSIIPAYAWPGVPESRAVMNKGTGISLQEKISVRMTNSFPRAYAGLESMPLRLQLFQVNMF